MMLNLNKELNVVRRARGYLSQAVNFDREHFKADKENIWRKKYVLLAGKYNPQHSERFEEMVPGELNMVSPFDWDEKIEMLKGIFLERSSMQPALDIGEPTKDTLMIDVIELFRELREQ